MRGIIVLTTLLATIAVSQAVQMPHQGDLKYYVRYETRHAAPEAPVDIPLPEHYLNERRVRKEEFNIEQKIKKLEEKVGFALKDLERQRLALDNEEDKIKTEVAATDRMQKQREDALKEDLNHEEKFREIYEDRVTKNILKAHMAMPDQVESYKKLINFDRQRISAWKAKEARSAEELNEAHAADTEQDAGLDNQVMEIEARKAQIDSKIHSEKARAHIEESRLEAKKDELESEVKMDNQLDNHRKQEQVAEAHAAAHLAQNETDMPAPAVPEMPAPMHTAADMPAPAHPEMPAHDAMHPEMPVHDHDHPEMPAHDAMHPEMPAPVHPEMPAHDHDHPEMPAPAHPEMPAGDHDHPEMPAHDHDHPEMPAHDHDHDDGSVHEPAHHVKSKLDQALDEIMEEFWWLEEADLDMAIAEWITKSHSGVADALSLSQLPAGFNGQAIPAHTGF